MEGFLHAVVGLWLVVHVAKLVLLLIGGRWVVKKVNQKVREAHRW